VWSCYTFHHTRLISIQLRNAFHSSRHISDGMVFASAQKLLAGRRKSLTCSYMRRWIRLLRNMWRDGFITQVMYKCDGILFKLVWVIRSVSTIVYNLFCMIIMNYICMTLKDKMICKSKNQAASKTLQPLVDKNVIFIFWVLHVNITTIWKLIFFIYVYQFSGQSRLIWASYSKNEHHWNVWWQKWHMPYVSPIAVKHSNNIIYYLNGNLHLKLI
jgi:hypothetical protein